MLNLLSGIALTSTLLIPSSIFAASKLLTINYDYLKANVSYTTQFRKVAGAPVKVETISIAQQGDYCDIALEKVEYTSERGGKIKEAKWINRNRYEIPSDSIYSISLDFMQRTWSNAACDLIVYAED